MERDKMDTSLNFNSNSNQLQKDSSSKEKTENAGVVAQNSSAKLFKTESESTETAGTIAQNSPSPLFSTHVETAGTIACNTNGSSNSGGSSLSAIGYNSTINILNKRVIFYSKKRVIISISI